MLNSFKREDEAQERKQLHCAHCKRETIHNLEARCKGAWEDPGDGVSGHELYSIFRCGACDTVCYETRGFFSEQYDQDVDGTMYLVPDFIQYPAPISAHFTFNTTSTPMKLNGLLDEMLYSLAGSKMTLATVGLRLVIEFIVNDAECKGASLYQKINDLQKQGIIDSDQTTLLHRIRKRGNAGAHEAVGMSANELVAGMGVIEGLLEKLYNGPARHEATIKKAKQLLRDEEDETHPRRSGVRSPTPPEEAEV